MKNKEIDCAKGVHKQKRDRLEREIDCRFAGGSFAGVERRVYQVDRLISSPNCRG
jgi:hypothetical protein